VNKEYKMNTQKPEQRTIKYFDYSDILRYIEEKYKLITYIPEENKDFWRWLIDTYDVHNGCYINFAVTEKAIEEMDIPDYVKEVIALIEKEFENYIDEYGRICFHIWW